MLQVNSPAPMFKGVALIGKEFREVSLSDYLTQGEKKGKWVVLFFYPLDFTALCPTEIKGFAHEYEEFKKRNTEVIGCSIDSHVCHKAWTEAPNGIGELPFPLLSDINKTFSKDYGVLLETKGFALRGTFIIDPNGIVQYMVIHNTNIGRSTDETIRVLDALQVGGLCPVNWKKGDKLIS